ncbi:MAG: excinuclease ABC subunit UvrC [Gammaproteobacteria bacterium]|nr:excinuclease ABC subunit UvrC [Gammaproteobacteria bacterium]
MSDFDSKTFLATVGHGPGVYRMYAGDKLIYIGKARDLRRRLGSYFGKRPASAKTAAMLRRLDRVEVTHTANEVEALLLEATLIKRHRPRYNVILRDDKSYPWIRLEPGLGFPRLNFYRGPERAGTRRFGPYPSAGAARTTLIELQRVFRLRNCSNHFFKNRTRPCLQYQIGRCSAPCVGYIDEHGYAADLEQAVAFLEGRNEGVMTALAKKMEAASAALEYEKAARLRDQIMRLRRVGTRQDVVGGVADCDVLALAAGEVKSAVALLPVREGRLLASRHYLLDVGVAASARALFESFVTQHYLESKAAIPPRLVCDRGLIGTGALAEALSQRAGHAVHLRSGARGPLRRLLALAETNAREALARRSGSAAIFEARFAALEAALDLPGDALTRIECFDISHSGGEEPMGSCVVFDRNGPVKEAYRRFRVRSAEPGDDYAALAEVLERRYRRQLEEKADLPELVLVDGGPAQVRRVQPVLDALGLERLRLAGVTKGPARRAAMDRLVLAPRGRTLALAPDSPALHLVQAMRDEAHRFAIAGHRRARRRKRLESGLDTISGIGPARRRQLLTHFGGLTELKRASAQELMRVPGISRALAERISAHFGSH